MGSRLFVFFHAREVSIIDQTLNDLPSFMIMHARDLVEQEAGQNDNFNTLAFLTFVTCRNITI